jgi:hypothetical protein
VKTNLAIAIALIALAPQGCGIADPSRGLATYFRNFLNSGKINFTEESRGMFPSSRMGYFVFTVPHDEWAKLKAALSLKEIAELETERSVCLSCRDQFKTVKNVPFDIWNIGWNPDDSETWLDDKGNAIKATKPGVSVFYADPPLPPMEGNSTTSFEHLIYDSTTGRCYAILAYPYG